MSLLEPPLSGEHEISDTLEGNLIRVSCSCGEWTALVTEQKFVKPVGSRHLILVGKIKLKKD